MSSRSFANDQSELDRPPPPEKFERRLDFDIRAIKHPAYTADMFGIVQYVNRAFVNFLLCIDNTVIDAWQASHDQGTIAFVRFQDMLHKQTQREFAIHDRAAARRNLAAKKREQNPHAVIKSPYGYRADRDHTLIIGRHIVEIALDQLNPNEHNHIHPGLTIGAYLCNLYSSYALRAYFFGLPKDPTRPRMPSRLRRAVFGNEKAYQDHRDRLSHGCYKWREDPSAEWCPSILEATSFEDIKSSLDAAVNEDGDAEKGELRHSPPDDTCTRAIGRWLRYCSTECDRLPVCATILDGHKKPESDAYDWSGLLATRDSMRQRSTAVEWAFVRMEGVELRNRRYIDMRQDLPLGPLVLDLFATFKSRIAWGCQGMFQVSISRMELLHDRMHTVSRLALQYVRHEINTPEAILGDLVNDCEKALHLLPSDPERGVEILDGNTLKRIPAAQYPEILIRELNALRTRLQRVASRSKAIMGLQIKTYASVQASRIVDMIRQCCDERKALFDCDHVPNLSVRSDARTDEYPSLSQITVLFENLVTNSKEKCDDEGIDCRIKLSVARAPAPYVGFVDFTLEDNGAGFKPEQLRALQDSESETVAFDTAGHGMGIQICKQIAMKHETSEAIKGRVLADNWHDDLGRTGARLTVRLPAAESSDRPYAD